MSNKKQNITGDIGGVIWFISNIKNGLESNHKRVALDVIRVTIADDTLTEEEALKIAYRSHNN